MDFYNIFIVICLALIAIAVRECARHLRKISEQLSEASQKGDEAVRLGTEVHFDLEHIRNELGSISSIVAQYENRQPHPYE